MRPDTLIQLIQAGAVKHDQPARGLVLYSFSVEKLEDIKSDLPGAVTIEDVEQLQAQHPFGIEVNVSDSTFLPDTDKADNLLDFGLQSLRLVAYNAQHFKMSENIKKDVELLAPVERAYHQFQSNRLALRELALPEHEKVIRAELIIDRFFDVVARYIHQAKPEIPMKRMAKYIGEQQQIHRSQRAIQDFAAIRVEGAPIDALVSNGVGTSAHVEILQRWYQRDGLVRSTAVAHNDEDESANYARKTIFQTTLQASGPASECLFEGASYVSLTPATCSKEEVALRNPLSEAVLVSSGMLNPFDLVKQAAYGVYQHATRMVGQVWSESGAPQNLTACDMIGLKADEIVDSFVSICAHKDKPSIEKLRAVLLHLVSLNNDVNDETPKWVQEFIAGCNEVVYSRLDQLVGDFEAFAITHISEKGDKLDMACALVGNDRLWSLVENADFFKDSAPSPSSFQRFDALRLGYFPFRSREGRSAFVVLGKLGVEECKASCAP
ncbi:MAG: hypothetical protein P1U34_05215 [Coxiellaceae bacterium]|nr:hypothetical protein [Coxiellaceae bacterium]